MLCPAHNMMMRMVHDAPPSQGGQDTGHRTGRGVLGVPPGNVTVSVAHGTWTLNCTAHCTCQYGCRDQTGGVCVCGAVQRVHAMRNQWPGFTRQQTNSTMRACARPIGTTRGSFRAEPHSPQASARGITGYSSTNGRSLLRVLAPLHQSQSRAVCKAAAVNSVQNSVL